MADTGTFGWFRWIGGRVQRVNRTPRLQVGVPVRVRRRRSPLSGMTGKISVITPNDAYGPYLVTFENGLQFRYRQEELAALTYFSIQQ